MRYLGGKSKHGKQLVQAIRDDGGLRSVVIEPFCGGLGMSEHLAKAPEVERIMCLDVFAPVISLYDALLEGWDPPTEVSESERSASLSLPDSDPFKAFARIGCGFAGHWTSGYANNDPGNDYCAQTRNSLRRTFLALKEKNVSFECRSFLGIDPYGDLSNVTLYCDPPYANTTKYSTGDFDHDRFWVLCSVWARLGAAVYVSEYSTMSDRAVEIWQKKTKSQVVKTGARDRVERLYRVTA